VRPHSSQKPVGHEIGVGAGVLVGVELAEAGPQFGRSAMVASSRRSALNRSVAPTLGMRPDRVRQLFQLGVPAGLLRTMSQPPDQLTHGDRRKRDCGDGTRDDHLSGGAVMLTGGPELDTPSEPEHGKTAQAEVLQNG
jgi:hypothetical protein